MKQGKVSYVFPGSNTPSGFLSFYREGLKGTENIFILKGGPGCGKSTLIRKIGLNMLERGYDVEFWQCSSDDDSLDGVRLPALSAAIIDGTPPHAIDPQYPGAVEEIVNLGEHWQGAELRRQRQEIVDLSGRISERFSSCYGKLREAGALLGAAQAENSRQLDGEQLSRQLEDLADEVFFQQRPRSRHLFASAVTPRGLVSYSEALSRRMERRILLCGPVGGGKEQLLAQLAALAEQRGHYAEIFHNALLPESIELLLLPELEMAVVARSQPPERPRENERVVLCGCQDDAAACELERQLEELTTAAASRIAEAKALHDQLEGYYRRAMDFPAVEGVGNRLFNRILALAAEVEDQP